jgi:hypothetical protein
MNTTTLADSRNRETQKPPTETTASALVVIGEEALNSRDVLRVAFDEYGGLFLSEPHFPKINFRQPRPKESPAHVDGVAGQEG